MPPAGFGVRFGTKTAHFGCAIRPQTYIYLAVMKDLRANELFGVADTAFRCQMADEGRFFWILGTMPETPASHAQLKAKGFKEKSVGNLTTLANRRETCPDTLSPRCYP